MHLHIRPATSDDFERIVAIINTQADGPTTVEEYRRQVALRPEGDPILRLVGVMADGLIGGYGVAATGAGMRPNHFQVNVRVEASYQGQGLGTALHQALEAYAQAEGGTHLDGNVKEEDPRFLVWAERRGYQKEHHLYRSTLHLAAFNAEPYRPALEQAQASGIRFASMADEFKGEETERRLYQVYETWGRDVPGQEEVPSITFDLFRDFMLRNPQFDPQGVWLAIDGDDRWVAIAQLITLTPGVMYHQFTGVDRDYRGRGLATAVKLVAMEWARTQGVTHLKTDNHSPNQRMLAVNRKMGYVPEPGMFTVTKRLHQ